MKAKESAKGNKKRIILVAAGVFVALLVIAYLAIGFYFNSRFWFRTTINGVDCSGKRVADVEQIITEEIGRYQIRIEERGGQTELIKSDEIGLKPMFDGSLENELASRSGFAWLISLFRDTSLEFETMVSYEEDKFEAVVGELECLQMANIIEPRDAYLSDYMIGVGYEIVPEEEGSRLETARLKEVLHDAVVNLKESVSLEENRCYLEPEIRSDNEELVELCEKMNTCASTVITYDFGDRTERLDGELIYQWLSIGEDNEITIDREQASEYVKGLAEKYNTAYKSRTFATSYGSTVTLSRNEYGWQIDREEETDQLIADIQAGSQTSREPVYKQRARSHGSQDYGNTYVEINLTAQHLYFYKDGSLVVESDFVSGNLAKGHDTPPGAFSLSYKQRDAVLRGEDYRTPVDYWMPFNGGVGLHDATWRRDFGGSYYKTNGSHGCINLPHSVAKKIYENIQSGDAVFVYHLPGTESAKGLAQDAAAAVTDTIKAIGSVTAESASAIQAARNAYDSLSDAAKEYVKNYDVLLEAETVYANLMAEQQAQQAAAQAKNEAQPVISAIQAIGDVTLDKQNAIQAARNQYNALSDSAKQYVTNLDVLVAAEARLQELLGANAG